MKKGFLLIIILMVSPFSLYSYDTYKLETSFQVGKLPVKTYWDESKQNLHVFCLGMDKNFNYVKDSVDGDENPSWWIIDFKSSTKIPQKVMEFDFVSLKFPFRPVFDLNLRKLFIPTYSKVESFDIDKFSIIDSNIANFDANSISITKNNLFCAVSEGYGKKGSLKIIDLTGKENLISINTGINTQEVVSWDDNGTIGFAVACVGNFGSDSSIIYFGKIQNKTVSYDSIIGGNSINYLYYNNNKLYAVMNGSHYVKEVDINTKTTRVFYTGTSAYNGPRECEIRNGNLYVSSYSGNIRVIDLDDNALINIINYRGDYNDIDGKFKNESISFLNDNKFIITNPFKIDYSANDNIEIYKNYEQMDNILSLNVGKQPVKSFFDEQNQKLHIFCLGYDKNNNGALDKVDGDEEPSWWVIDYNKTKIESEKVKDFNLGDFVLPFRPGFSIFDKSVLIPTKNSIRAYDLNNYSLIFENEVFKNINTISAVDNIVLATENHGKDSNGVLNIFINPNLSLLQSNDIAPNPTESLIYYNNGDYGGAFLTKDYAKNISTLYFGAVDNFGNLILDTLYFGINVNHLAFDEGFIYLTDSELNKVSIIDISKKSTKEIYTGNYGINGIRECFPIGKNLIISSWQGDIRAYNNKSECIDLIIPFLGKVESTNIIQLEHLDRVDIVCLIRYNMDGSIGNTVNILNPIQTDINDEPIKNETYMELYPNPAQNQITINLNKLNSILKSEITDLQGKVVRTIKEPFKNSIIIDDLNLQSGIYFINIYTSNGIFSKQFNIVK